MLGVVEHRFVGIEDHAPRLRGESLRELGVASRAELARSTGLSPATVSTLVSQLVETGMVVDAPASVSRRNQGGRPPALITLDPSVGVAIGIDFGKRHLAVALADLSHRLLAEEWREMADDYDAEDGIQEAAELVQLVVDASGADAGRLLGVGMGLPGPVHRSGVVGSSAILPGWAGTLAAERMAERLSMEVWLSNDANLGALAEATWGAGRDAAGLVYLKLATGIGAGIVIGGRLFEGTGGTAGEIGRASCRERVFRTV